MQNHQTSSRIQTPPDARRGAVTGNGTLTLDVTGQHLANSDQVFLVE